MTTAPQRFVVRYKKNDGSQHMLQLHAANRQEARIVAMETDAVSGLKWQSFCSCSEYSHPSPPAFSADSLKLRSLLGIPTV